MFSIRSPAAAIVPCGQLPRKMPPPPSLIQRSGPCVSAYFVPKPLPGNETSSSIDPAPAIQTTPAARGLSTPGKTPIELTIFLPPFGATSTPIGSPSPAKPGDPFASAIDVFPGFRPIKAVSGLSASDSVTRYVPLGRNRTRYLSMAACNAAVSSVFPSPFTSSVCTFTHSFIGGSAGISLVAS